MQDSVIATVNVAGCFRNMGAVARLLHRYETAVTHFQCAADLYLTARARVHTVLEQNNNANTTSTSTTTHTTESSAAEDHLCLDLMLI
jgi:hypothetical protein